MTWACEHADSHMLCCANVEISLRAVGGFRTSSLPEETFSLSEAAANSGSAICSVLVLLHGSCTAPELPGRGRLLSERAHSGFVPAVFEGLFSAVCVWCETCARQNPN